MDYTHGVVSLRVEHRVDEEVQRQAMHQRLWPGGGRDVDVLDQLLVQRGQRLVLQRPDFKHVEGLEGINEIGAFVARQGGDASARAVSSHFVNSLVN